MFLLCTQALALYMGHSIEMQRGTYDRRTKQQKVEPAVSGQSKLGCTGVKRVSRRCCLSHVCSAMMYTTMLRGGLS